MIWITGPERGEIFEQMTLLKWKYAELAEKVGTDPSHISRLLKSDNGQWLTDRQINEHLYDTILDKLHLPPRPLADLSDDEMSLLRAYRTIKTKEPDSGPPALAQMLEWARLAKKRAELKEGLPSTRPDAFGTFAEPEKEKAEREAALKKPLIGPGTTKKPS